MGLRRLEVCRKFSSQFAIWFIGTTYNGSIQQSFSASLKYRYSQFEEFGNAWYWEENETGTSS